RQPRGEIEGLAVEILAAVLRRRRAGEEKPLRVGAAELAQLLELLPALDALGHYLDVEVLRHGDDGAHDREVREVRHQVAHEAAVDLERIHAPALEVRSEEHTSELQSRFDLVCRLLLEKKKKKQINNLRKLN